MKKLIITAFYLIFTVALFAQNQKIDFTMDGNWYCPKTNQFFAIQTDKDGTIKGRGVYYGNGTGKMVQMQIMSQDREVIESGEVGYYVLVYDPAKSKTVYKLVTYIGIDDFALTVREVGPKKKSYIFYNLKNMQPKKIYPEDE